MRTKDKFDGFYIWGERGGLYTRGAYTREENHFNLQSVKLTFFFFFFFQYKARISAYVTSCKIWSMFEVNIKDTRMRKVNVRVKNKAPLTLFWSLYCQLWAHFTSCYSVLIAEFVQLIAGWGCWLLFWCFVPAGINLGKVTNYGKTR